MRRRGQGAAALAALVAAALAVQGPARAEGHRVFRDWIVGCDNTRVCRAVAAGEDIAISDRPHLVVDRAGGAVTVTLTGPEGLPAGPVALAIDGRRWDAVVGADGFARWTGAPAMALARALVSGRSATLGRAGARGPGPSLAGAAAALLWMDEAQRQLGTVAGIARPGSAPAVPAPAAPEVRAWRGARTAPASSALIAAVRRVRGLMRRDCVFGDRPPMDDAHPLDAVHTLVLLECDSGAYNVNVVPVLVTRGQAGSARPAPGLPGAITNASWEAETGLLTEFSKGRGLADCGTLERWAWTGSRFVSALRQSMGECRGVAPSWWITDWRTGVRG